MLGKGRGGFARPLKEVVRMSRETKLAILVTHIAYQGQRLATLTRVMFLITAGAGAGIALLYHIVWIRWLLLIVTILAPGASATVLIHSLNILAQEIEEIKKIK